MFTLNCAGRILLVDKPIVMGIINTTPDSFFVGSRQQAIDAALQRAESMINQGASILDFGGQSTRPGSSPITEQEELQRVIAPLAAIAKAFPETFISIDTYFSRVVMEAISVGASLVNDISAGSLDEKMLDTVASLSVPYVLMHMKGNPQNMQSLVNYENVSAEVLDFFIKKVSLIKAAGIKDIIIDPGFGFSKTPAQNFQLLRELNIFKYLKLPILAGISRKGTIYKTLNTTADQALNGTTVLNTIALMNGASILRVHDVKEAKEAIQLITALKNA